MINIIYENENLAVIDKPAGLSVHPAPNNQDTTLVDLILSKYPEMKKYKWPIDRGLSAEALAKAGIVHRLDKDTSGLIVVAKNPDTQKFLQEQFKSRTTSKIYLALVLGKVEPQEGKIVADIGRDQKNRLQQRVTPMVFPWTKGKTRPAETHYKVLKHLHLKPYTLSLLEVKPLTGRMHQIRVHLKYLGYPIIGDPIYNTKESREISQKLGLNRQFLHAHKLKIKLPNGSEKEFESKLPNDLLEVLDHISIT